MPETRPSYGTQLKHNRQEVSDLDYVVTTNISAVFYTSLSATRTVRLPPLTSYRVGSMFFVSDESGSCTPTIAINIRDSTGVTFVASLIHPFAHAVFVNNGSRWIPADLTREQMQAHLNSGPLADTLNTLNTNLSGQINSLSQQVSAANGGVANASAFNFCAALSF